MLVWFRFWFKNACVLKRGLLKVENISELAPQGVSQIVYVQIDCRIEVGNPLFFFFFFSRVLHGECFKGLLSDKRCANPLAVESATMSLAEGCLSTE